MKIPTVALPSATARTLPQSPLARIRALAAPLLSALALAACTSGASTEAAPREAAGEGAQPERSAVIGTTEAAEAAEAPPTPVYSPFVVDLEGDGPFHVISFKDVGMSLPPDERAATYESLAESLNMALMSGPVSLDGSVRHAPETTAPSAHVTCETGHLYVDVWRSSSSPGHEDWGYSLWSGCGPGDEFAHESVPAPASEDLTTRVAPLAEGIARSLSGAMDRGCFTRTC